MKNTPESDQELTDGFNAGWLDWKIGKKTGRTAEAIKTRRLELGLRRAEPNFTRKFKTPKTPSAEPVSLYLDPMVLQDVTQRASAAGVPRDKYIKRIFYQGFEAERAA